MSQLPPPQTVGLCPRCHLVGKTYGIIDPTPMRCAHCGTPYTGIWRGPPTAGAAATLPPLKPINTTGANPL